MVLWRNKNKVLIFFVQNGLPRAIAKTYKSFIDLFT